MTPLRVPRAPIASAALTLAIVLVSAPFVHAQSFTVIYNFSGGADGAGPSGGLTLDTPGNLYGTTVGGGVHY